MRSATRRTIGPAEYAIEREIKMELERAWRKERKSHLCDNYDDDFQSQKDGCFD